MLQMSYVLVKNTYICMYNLCILYSNNNKAISIITYRICVYGCICICIHVYVCVCVCEYKIVLREALWNEFYSYFTDEEACPRERQDTQDPKVRRGHDQTSRCSESPHSLVACLWNMPYSILTVASASVYSLRFKSSLCCSGLSRQKCRQAQAFLWWLFGNWVYKISAIRIART